MQDRWLARRGPPNEATWWAIGTIRAMMAPVGEEQEGRTSPMAVHRVGDHGTSGDPGVVGAEDLMPHASGTPRLNASDRWDVPHLLSIPIQSEAVSRLTGWRASDRWDGPG